MTHRQQVILKPCPEFISGLIQCSHPELDSGSTHNALTPPLCVLCILSEMINFCFTQRSQRCGGWGSDPKSHYLSHNSVHSAYSISLSHTETAEMGRVWLWPLTIISPLRGL